MLRGAIVGFGGVARYGHWPAYAASPDAGIVAVVDRTPERRAEAAAWSPDVATFASLDELAAGCTVDFVDICTPPAFHAGPMIAALDRGWHVVCEKPFLLDAAVLALVRARALEAGLAVVPVHNWKYAPIVRHATAVLRSGGIGLLRRVEIETRRIGESPVVDPHRPNWRREAAIAGGGILMDHGWHALYLALHWFREDPLEVRAALHWPSGHEVEDEADITIAFPSGDATIALTWNAAARHNTMRLVGDAGELVVDDDVLHVRPRSGEPTSIPFEGALSAGSHHEDWFAAMLPDVVAAFRDPRTAQALLAEAEQCLSVIQRAYAQHPSDGCSAAL